MKNWRFILLGIGFLVVALCAGVWMLSDSQAVYANVENAGGGAFTFWGDGSELTGGGAGDFTALTNGSGCCTTAPVIGTQTYNLYAGQDILVGYVEVSNDADELTVQYFIDSPWVMTESHLQVAASLSGIPQTKTGNPIPGKFTEGEIYPVPVSGDTFIISLGDWDPCDTLYVAAHAKVWDTSSIATIVLKSEVGDDVYGPIYTAPTVPIDLAEWGSPSSAVQALNNIAGSTWDWGTTPPRAGVDINDATVLWISTAPDTENWTVDSWRLFTNTFDVPGIPVSGSVTVNADNEFWAYFNGTQIGTDDNIWNGLHTYPFMPEMGSNSLDFIVQNWAQAGDQVNNPNGLTYLAEIQYYDRSETAWAEHNAPCSFGEIQFPGANWATYFTYDVQWTLMETLNVPATSSAGVDSSSLSNGELYCFVASGTYRFGNWGDYGIADAEYNYRNDAWGSGWTLGEDTFPPTFPAYALDVLVDGANVYWGDYNSTHAYAYDYTGDGTTVHFNIWDSAYGDNSGSITVDIYE